MLETDSAFQSPATISAPLNQQPRLTRAMIGLLVLVFPLVGGIVGFNGYLAVGSLLTTMIQSKISLGQQAGLVSLPICTLVCGSIGLGLVFMLIRRYLTAACILFAVGLCSSVIICALWKSQVSKYGEDSSEYVLYYPPLVCSAVALLLALIAVSQRLLSSNDYGTSSGKSPFKH